MASDWRTRLNAAGFADVLPHLERQSAALDAGVVDEASLQALGLDAAELAELVAVLRAGTPSVASREAGVANAVTAQIPSPHAPTVSSTHVLAQSRVTRALAEGDAPGAAAALSAAGVPADPAQRAEYAVWLAGPRRGDHFEWLSKDELLGFMCLRSFDQASMIACGDKSRAD
jgi:hypothetical protein